MTKNRRQKNLKRYTIYFEFLCPNTFSKNKKNKFTNNDTKYIVNHNDDMIKLKLKMVKNRVKGSAKPYSSPDIAAVSIKI